MKKIVLFPEIDKNCYRVKAYLIDENGSVKLLDCYELDFPKFNLEIQEHFKSLGFKEIYIDPEFELIERAFSYDR